MDWIHHFYLTYYEGDIDGADGVTLVQSWARGSWVEIKHFGLIVCERLSIGRKLDKLLCPVFPINVKGRQQVVFSHMMEAC